MQPVRVHFQGLPVVGAAFWVQTIMEFLKIFLFGGYFWICIELSENLKNQNILTTAGRSICD